VLTIESQVLKTVTQTVQELAGKVSRLLRRLHLYGLIAKVPHAQRWRVTKKGHGCSAAHCACATTCPGALRDGVWVTRCKNSIKIQTKDLSAFLAQLASCLVSSDAAATVAEETTAKSNTT
jgi:hypothetical protein